MFGTCGIERLACRFCDLNHVEWSWLAGQEALAGVRWEHSHRTGKPLRMADRKGNDRWPGGSCQRPAGTNWVSLAGRRLEKVSLRGR